MNAFAITQSMTKDLADDIAGGPGYSYDAENYGPDNLHRDSCDCRAEGKPTGPWSTSPMARRTLARYGALNSFRRRGGERLRPDTVGRCTNIVATYLGDTNCAGFEASPTIVAKITVPPQPTVTTGDRQPLIPTDVALGTTFNIAVTGSRTTGFGYGHCRPGRRWRVQWLARRCWDGTGKCYDHRFRRREGRREVRLITWKTSAT